MPHTTRVNESGFSKDLQERGESESNESRELREIAERARKCQRIKQQVEAGTYKVDSQTLAKAVLGIEE